jgi:DNA repair exonuclease SbcCD nuclease subunit
MKKLTTTIAFTDLHVGAKSNSELHNQDCLDYIDWFCLQAIKHKADNVIFMGDWYENRAAVNVSTLNYSHRCAKKLNDLGIPIFFVIGNHDLYHRHNRDLYSTITFHEFSNFRMITEPTIVDDIETSPLICPYLFHHEYDTLVQYDNVATWWGHFEFKGFVITGHNVIMTNGPDHTLFTGPTYIFSGHFHKRQQTNNTVYIGNAFPTNFSDADDNDRGLMVYNHTSQQKTFVNWEDCPKYTKVKLSDVLDGNVSIYPNSRVKCLVDVPINFEESSVLKQTLTTQYQLRECSMDESSEVSEAITDTEASDIDTSDTSLRTIDELVLQMLNDIDTDHIDNELLIAQYLRLA